jgi:hypothetical protein
MQIIQNIENPMLQSETEVYFATEFQQKIHSIYKEGEQ